MQCYWENPKETDKDKKRCQNEATIEGCWCSETHKTEWQADAYKGSKNVDLPKRYDQDYINRRTKEIQAEIREKKKFAGKNGQGKLEIE